MFTYWLIVEMFFLFILMLQVLVEKMTGDEMKGEVCLVRQ
jgi:hypothetical protein